MSLIKREMAARIRDVIEELDQEAEMAVRGWERALLATQDQDLLLGGAALSVHGYYTGLEKLFSHIAKRIDQTLPSGDTWHIQLLDQMAEPLSGVRPAVLTTETARNVRELLRFRHVVRNIYVSNLDAERVRDLTNIVRRLRIELPRELLAFADYLDQ